MVHAEVPRERCSPGRNAPPSGTARAWCKRRADVHVQVSSPIESDRIMRLESRNGSEQTQADAGGGNRRPRRTSRTAPGARAVWFLKQQVLGDGNRGRRAEGASVRTRKTASPETFAASQLFVAREMIHGGANGGQAPEQRGLAELRRPAVLAWAGAMGNSVVCRWSPECR
ncbi:hypothetical protein K505DRAFT_125609 [Melanomma pulvis-pyrius CBS 109.77]|uniref:Uncharacterized protein n=1 Tax=Melanomma pulvis-pyrius CBS 109.77 TaxID=1314802 RepID=A0A6A6WTR1_9PLEO|nr:hypothetical protein K505DRAFT_125609 [Melanomma pulvis-pyrius CBS 109.77]